MERSDKMENKEEWITAAEAAGMLKPAFGTYEAQMTICRRAHSGMIRARAMRFIIGGRTRDNFEIPKEFWWAEGHQALEQNWTAGDFHTWAPDRETRLQAFGVSFLRAAIEKLLPAEMPARSPPQASAKHIDVVSSPAFDLSTVAGLALRFHESVLALKKHPHGGQTFVVKDEWDCQYLFRSILAGYFRDVRTEEWSPSVAGSASRCEFFLKQNGIMVELKYVRKAEDQKRIKTQLLTDLADYGANPSVEYVVTLVYDPDHHLPAAVQLQDDLSGPSKGLKDVKVIVSPPR